MVLFDGQDEVEAASSNQLQIYLEAYGQRQGTPPPSPSRNISQTTKPTGKKASRPLRDRGNGQISYAENGSDNDDDDDDDDNNDDDNDDNEDYDNASQQNESSIDSGNLDTPRASPTAQSRARRRAVGTPTDLFSRDTTAQSDDNSDADSAEENYFHAAEGEDFDDRIEDEEDDDGRGTRMSWVDQNGEDREAFVDEPQKKALYEAAKAKMEADRFAW